jgi:hypothetical protein
MKFRLSFLRNESGETPEGGGTGTTPPPAAPEAPETPAAPAEPDPEPAPEPEKPAEGQKVARLSLLQLADAAVSSKAKLIAENGLMAKALAEAEESRDDLRQQVAEMTGNLRERDVELSALRAERADLEKALKAAKEADESAEQKAAGIVATQFGIPSGKLPEQAVAGESREELMAALDAEKDPAKRFELAARINKMRA